MSLRRDAAYTHSDLTVLDNIFIFEVLCSIMCFTDNLMFREKRIRSSSAVSMTSTGFANMTWHGIPLTPSPVGWSSRLVEASKIHNPDKPSDKSCQNVFFSVKRKLRGVCPAGGVWLGVHRPQRSHPILYQVFSNISTIDPLVGQL